MHWHERFLQRAALQEGLLARFQVGELGCSTHQWWQARRNGRWVVLSPRVVALRGSPATDERRALAAVLDASPGALLHGASALAWLGVRGYGLGELTVARPRGINGQAPTLAKVHYLRALRAHDVIVVRGVPCETALRAIWSEAARYASPALSDIGAKKIGNLLDAAHRLDLVTWAGLHEMVDDIHERGRAGTVIMRALAEVRPPGSSPTESHQETRLEELLAEVGARPLRRQPVVGGHEPIGRTDHRDDDLPLVVETNSLRYHTTPSDRTADERRYLRLTTGGFTVAVVWEPDLWSHPQHVAPTIARARALAAAGLAVVIHSPGCPWPPPLLGAPDARSGRATSREDAA